MVAMPPTPLAECNTATLDVTASDGRTWIITLTWTPSGVWSFDRAGHDFELEIGPEAFGDWLCDLWHGTDVGRHVWRLGNPPLAR